MMQRSKNSGGARTCCIRPCVADPIIEEDWLGAECPVAEEDWLGAECDSASSCPKKAAWASNSAEGDKWDAAHTRHGRSAIVGVHCYHTVQNS